MFCRKCGNQMADGYKFCPYCGTPNYEEPKQEAGASETIHTQKLYDEPVEEEKSPLNVGMLVWSIVNIVLSPSLSVLGIIALILTIISNHAPVKVAASRLKAARILNIIATVCCVLAYMAYIAILVGLSLGGNFAELAREWMQMM